MLLQLIVPRYSHLPEDPLLAVLCPSREAESGPLLPVATAAFRGFLPILYGRDDRQRLNSGGVPFVCGSELLTDRQCADI